MIIDTVQVADGHIFKEYGRIFADFLIRSDEGIIRIHLRCLFIIISSAHLSDIADFIFIPVCDQTQFRMDLIIFKSIEYTTSGLLHPL